MITKVERRAPDGTQVPVGTEVKVTATFPPASGYGVIERTIVRVSATVGVQKEDGGRRVKMPIDVTLFYYATELSNGRAPK